MRHLRNRKRFETGARRQIKILSNSTETRGVQRETNDGRDRVYNRYREYATFVSIFVLSMYEYILILIVLQLM